jgi:hypothetical protein
MKLHKRIDVSVQRPNAPSRRARLGGEAIVLERLNLRNAEPDTSEMLGLPPRIAADGAPADVVLRRS